jgi:hypothetical protein
METLAHNSSHVAPQQPTYVWKPTYCSCGNPSRRSIVTSPIDTCDSCADCGHILAGSAPFDPFNL